MYLWCCSATDSLLHLLPETSPQCVPRPAAPVYLQAEPCIYYQPLTAEQVEAKAAGVLSRGRGPPAFGSLNKVGSL